MGRTFCATNMTNISVAEISRMTTAFKTFMKCSPVVLLALALLVSLPAAWAEDAPAEKVTYDDHVRPIFRQHCLTCHSADSKKGDLAIDTYASTIEGGASGEVVFEADPDSSRLWLLVNHEDEPKMPPESNKLPADKLEVIRKWIEGGLLEKQRLSRYCEKESRPGYDGRHQHRQARRSRGHA